MPTKVSLHDGDRRGKAKLFDVELPDNLEPAPVVESLGPTASRFTHESDPSSNDDAGLDLFSPQDSENFGAVPDPFDLDSLRVDPSYVEDGEATTELLEIGYGKPTKEDWFRVRPGKDWQETLAILDRESTRETYLVTRPIKPLLSHWVRDTYLFLVVNAQGEAKFWPIKVPKKNFVTAWTRTAVLAAKSAETSWVQLRTMSDRYSIAKPKIDFGEPRWPEGSYIDLLKKCFLDRIIDNADHPVVQELLGLAK